MVCSRRSHDGVSTCTSSAPSSPAGRDVPDHKKSLTLSGEVRTYRNGRAVIFVRLGMTTPWGFRVIAVDEKTSIPLLHAQAETYEIAVSRIESDLRDLEVIE